MDRFIWVDSKELHDSIFGMNKRDDGSEYSGYGEEDEGFVYDTKEQCSVMDFGNNEQYYPSCGVKPDDKYLKIIMDALNEDN